VRGGADRVIDTSGEAYRETRKGRIRHPGRGRCDLCLYFLDATAVVIVHAGDREDRPSRFLHRPILRGSLTLAPQSLIEEAASILKLSLT